MIYVKYKNGKKLPGVVLALGGQYVRIAIKDNEDAIEYRLVSGRWVSEDCEVVTFEFVSENEDESHMLPAIFPSESETTSLRVM
jgi:hypothetical protein